MLNALHITERVYATHSFNQTLPSQDSTVFQIKSCVNVFLCLGLVVNLVTSGHKRGDIKNRFINASAPMRQVAPLVDQEVLLLNEAVLIACKGSSTSPVLTCC